MLIGVRGTVCRAGRQMIFVFSRAAQSVSGFPCLAVQTSIRKARAWIKSQQKPLAWDPQGVRPLKPAAGVRMDFWYIRALKGLLGRRADALFC